MKEKKQVNSYRAPECQLVPVGTSYLMQTSFPNTAADTTRRATTEMI